jgi:hypothetical protein
MRISPYPIIKGKTANGIMKPKKLINRAESAINPTTFKLVKSLRNKSKTINGIFKKVKIELGTSN